MTDWKAKFERLEPKGLNVVCETCRYAGLTEGTDKVFCYRYPPKIAIDLDFEPYTLWPETRKDDFCGEWDFNNDLLGEAILYRNRYNYPPEPCYSSGGENPEKGQESEECESEGPDRR